MYCGTTPLPNVESILLLIKINSPLRKSLLIHLQYKIRDFFRWKIFFIIYINILRSVVPDRVICSQILRTPHTKLFLVPELFLLL